MMTRGRAFFLFLSGICIFFPLLLFQTKRKNARPLVIIARWGIVSFSGTRDTDSPREVLSAFRHAATLLQYIGSGVVPPAHDAEGPAKFAVHVHSLRVVLPQDLMELKVLAQRDI